MFKKLMKLVVGDPTKKLLDSLQPIVDQVASLERGLEALDDEALRGKTGELRQRLEGGETLDDLLPEAYAVVREASRRTTGLRHYDVQIMGGTLLHRGEVVEMRTGEGKTLVATLPLYLNALAGRGVHLVTVNDYLARRDGGWMGNIFHALGLTVGCIGPQRFSALYDPDYVNPGAELEDERLVHWRPVSRRQAYLADITYGTSSEFGFDYLRDNMTQHPSNLVQRELYLSIIDEVDNVLIDEARTPLIISGPAPQSGKEYSRFAKYVKGLKENTAEEDEEPNGHYDLDAKSKSVTLTELGMEEVEKRIPEVDVTAGESLYDPQHFHLTYYLENAVKAEYLFHRDHEYVVQDGEVIIVDDFTGRLMPGRRFSEGLHEAIEAKEGVEIQRETITVATITLQNYFRLYERLGGMTGTAVTDAEEFAEIYELGVTPLPTNVQYIVDRGTMGLIEKRTKLENAEQIAYLDPKTNEPAFFKRTDFPDQVYSSTEAKDKAIVHEVKRIYEQGRPVLVGTTSVEHSELIHKLLKRERVPHNVLNAKIHQSEALLVAQAGRRGMVTISTNMAGRGTDILLGGNPEGLAAEMMERVLFDRNLLTQLAAELLQSGHDAAIKMATKHKQLSPELVPALEKMKAEYDEALAEIEEVQVAGYLARVLQEPYDTDYNTLLQVVRLVRVNRLNGARSFLQERGIDTALVEEVLRLFGVYSRYQQASQDTRQTAEFLAEQLFEQHYNARAALIRAVLGGNDAEAKLLTEEVPGLPATLIEHIHGLVADTAAERKAVWDLGGLHVVGSERHESRRIDNQLRGRAARQGDPGSSRFFLSLEDDLMRRFGGDRLRRLINSINVDDMPIENSVLDRLIESSQERIEGYNFDIRKNLVEYDDVMSQQREAIYEERRAILMSDTEDGGHDERIDACFEMVIEDLVVNYLENYVEFAREQIQAAVQAFSTDATDSINLNGVINRLRRLLPTILEVDRDELTGLKPAKLEQRLVRLARENEESGQNLYQLVQEMGRFLPLLPAIPNLGAILTSRRGGYLQTRDNIRRDFLAQVESLFDSFLAEYVSAEQKQAIWERAKNGIRRSFDQYTVEGVPMERIREQQSDFRREVDDVLRTLLVDSLAALDSDQIEKALLAYTKKQRELWRERIGEEQYKDFQRLLLLSAIDREWRDYLTAMDDLRREIGLEAIAQRDPKVEYRRRSFQMFADMRHNIDTDVVERFFRQVQSHQQFIKQQEAQAAKQLKASQSGYTVVERNQGKGQEVRRDIPKVGRNDPCPCGSGKKYKQCHMRKDQKV
ncbi:MAG TPA: SEC-C metal-binding domain-containing protein [Anaerolineae bacterium]|nr:SEC-C metal-binding domain-containing protein [Anaerolineae bacterium]